MKNKYYRNKLKAAEILNSIQRKSSRFWEKEEKRKDLELFRQASQNVPAYKKFLRKNKLNPNKVRTYRDFVDEVPTISKKDYLRKNPIEDLCWGGTLKNPLVFTSTSGSTGEPFYFPRWEYLDWEYSLIVEDYLRNSSYKTKGPILVIIGFGMGVWIGGLITYKAFEIASQRAGIPVSIITPGISKPEIFKALKNIAPHYKETILVGYPPFLKDIIDESKSEKINLKELNIRLFSAAESYTEKFRDYLVKKAGVKNTYLDVLNVYGTADIGAMAWETPTSILIRRLASKNKKLFSDIFLQSNKTPTLAQYNPMFISFESINGEILLTGNNDIPLIRYKVGDQGGVASFDEINSKLKEYGIDLEKEAKKVGINHLTRLPFVYVLERSDFSVSLYGLNIYPEPIREALLAQPSCNYLTGKFTLEIEFDKKQNQIFIINVELIKNTVPKAIQKSILKAIIESLEDKNSEYKELRKFLGNRALPKLRFWPKGDIKYFKPGIKQKWVNKK